MCTDAASNTSGSGVRNTARTRQKEWGEGNGLRPLLTNPPLTGLPLLFQHRSDIFGSLGFVVVAARVSGHVLGHWKVNLFDPLWGPAALVWILSESCCYAALPSDHCCVEMLSSCSSYLPCSRWSLEIKHQWTRYPDCWWVHPVRNKQAVK